jgi:hypothetical protein
MWAYTKDNRLINLETGAEICATVNPTQPNKWNVVSSSSRGNVVLIESDLQENAEKQIQIIGKHLNAIDCRVPLEQRLRVL